MPKIQKPTPKGDASGIPVWCLHDEIVDIADLRPNPRNKNVHPDKQIALFARVLRKNGWRRPIVVSNLSGLVIKGHGALEAAKLLKVEKVPVAFQDYATEARETEDMLADNKIARESYEDIAGLKEVLSELDAELGGDLEATGYSDAELEVLLGMEKPDDGGQAHQAPGKKVCCPNCGDEFEVEGNEVPG